MRHLWLYLSVAAIVLAAGCSRRPAPTATEPTPPPRPQARTTVSMWTIWNTEPRKSALMEIVEAFETAHPEYAVAVTNAEPDAYKTSIRVQLGSAEPPDVFFVWDGEWLQNFVRAGAVLDLTPYMEADGGAWQARFQSEGLRRFTHDGRIWGVPYLLQCTFFLYNKDLFSRLNLSVPRTWPELLDLVTKIREAGLIPIALGNQQRWPAHHFPAVLFQRLMGEEAVARDYDPLGPGAYSDPGWMKGMELFEEFLERKPFNDAPNAVTRESARAMFYSGQAVMFYTGTWDFARLREGGEAPREFWDQWDFFDFPSVPGGKGDQAALAGAPDGYVVSARSKHSEAAVAFLQFMTQTEQAQGFVRRCQELVQIKDAVTEDNANPALRKYAKMVASAEHICPWSDTLMERSVADEFLNGVQALLDGKMTSKQVLEAVRKRQAEVKKRLLAEMEKSHQSPGGGPNQ